MADGLVVIDALSLSLKLADDVPLMEELLLSVGLALCVADEDSVAEAVDEEELLVVADTVELSLLVSEGVPELVSETVSDDEGLAETEGLSVLLPLEVCVCVEDSDVLRDSLMDLLADSDALGLSLALEEGLSVDDALIVLEGEMDPLVVPVMLSVPLSDALPVEDGVGLAVEEAVSLDELLREAVSETLSLMVSEGVVDELDVADGVSLVLEVSDAVAVIVDVSLPDDEELSLTLGVSDADEDSMLLADPDSVADNVIDFEALGLPLNLSR